MAHRRGEAGFLAPGDEVVEQHAEALFRPRPERTHLVLEVVGAVEPLDDDPLDAEVVAPHLLDQLGVVHALDPDPAAARDARLRAHDRPAARTRCARPSATRGLVVGRVARTGTRCVGVPSTAKVPGRLR